MRNQGLSNFLGAPIISGTGKATNFKFCTHSHGIDQYNTKPIKNFGKSSRCRSQGVPKVFRALIYRSHRLVIFAIAQVSFSLLGFVLLCFGLLC